MTTKNSEIMTPDEVAEYFGMAINVVYRELSNGNMPGRRIGRKWYISRTRIMQWLKEGNKNGQ